MAINNFKPFALDPNANVTSQADWEALPALLSGFTAGKASSAQVNKAIRQASFIAAALAQYTANKSGLDVLDDGDLNGFISKMGTAFGKDFQALDATLSALAGLATGANKLPYFTGNDTAAQTDLTSVGRDIIGKKTIADILTYLGLHETGFATLTSSGSFTVPDGVTELWISGCAGGAGGGGSQTTSNVTVAGSGGGSSGGFVQRFKLAVTPGQVIPYTIGAAGTGGAAGGGIGGDGGNTTFGSYLTLLGGKGGAVGQSASYSASGGIGGLGGPAGSGGGHGSWGGDSQNINGGGAYGGKGGDCPFGSAGGQVRGNVNPISGMDAVGYGSGGGGAGGANVNGAHTGAKGGNGAPGVLFIEW